MAKLSWGATAAGNDICNSSVIVLKRDIAHSEIKVAVVNESDIFKGFSVELRGFSDFGFFLDGGRRRSGVSLVLFQKRSEFVDLLTQFGIRWAGHDAGGQ